jgi:hypothetical protein
MRHTLEALAALQPVTEEYTVNLQRQPAGHLAVEVEWDSRRHGKDVVPRTHFTLPGAPDSAAAVRGVMLGMLRECDAVRAEADGLDAECERLEAAVGVDLEPLEGVAADRRARDEDVAVKVAALLVSKERKLAELREQAEKVQGGGG